ncbi:hypothetical protein [Sorangium sp. So ce363]|uniref:hypothetical protein n=1 Tax=Sorangium sp. So ce363 TaxID=3133304 RepID=UPI003F5DC990
MVDANGQLTDECETSKSSVVGFTFTAEAGLMHRILGRPTSHGDAFQVAFLAGVGHQGLHLTRSAKHSGPCPTCAAERLDIDGGAYLAPGLELSNATRRGSAVGLQIAYRYFLGGDIGHALRLGLFLDAW